VADGYGVERFPVMFNDFILVGPLGDPAGIAGATTATEALTRIYNTQSTFVSRGDDSGTYARELTLWDAAGLSPSLTDTWYLPIGQGMGETLLFTEEKNGYTLSDRGTYLSMAEELPDLGILFGGQTIAENLDPAMQNPYGVIQVTPENPSAPDAVLARSFVEWLGSLETQTLISDFGVETYGQPLFYPASDAWCADQGAGSPGCSGT
jgi:tungstate transport system substrate-binding protein